MTLKMMEKPPAFMPLPAGGKTRFQMTSVSDCAEACMLAATSPGVAGEAFNIGADDTLSMRDQVIELLKRRGKSTRIISIPPGLAKALLLIGYHLGVSKLEPDHFSLFDTDMVMDCAKAKRMLGWQPKQTNLDMILETFEAYLKEKSASR
jgi:nucleoside-diphosphate-sugar epimerase